MPHLDSPASISIHRGSTISTLGSMMGLFNNLIMFDQHVKQNSSQSMEADPGKRKQIVWEIEKRLAEDSARPIIYPVSAACW
jgi:hypothetical protein